MISRLILMFIVGCLSLPVMAQQVEEHEQVAFPDSIPAGGYSGITWFGDDRYAVVSDNGKDGFFLFRISIDSVGAVR